MPSSKGVSAGPMMTAFLVSVSGAVEGMTIASITKA